MSSEGLRVRIGPSVDRAAFDAAFASIGQSAKRAFEKIGQESQKAGAAEAKAAQSALANIQKARQTATRAEETEASRMLRTLEASERLKVHLAQRTARDRASAEREWQRQNERTVREAAREQKQYYDGIKRQAKEAAAEASRAARPRVGVSLGHGVALGMSGLYGGAAGILRYGMGIAGDIAHAYGVNTSMGTAMQRNADLETIATQVTNEAHEKGNSYASAQDLQEQAFDIGSKTGTGANEIMKGFQEFVGRTGDLSTAQQSMEQLAKIAKATGSSLTDITSAAAAVSNQLGDTPNKAQKLNEAMMVLAGESKLGAVPMRVLAAQAPKIVASAQMFEGDIGANIAMLGGIAQETGLRGGVGSGAQAATAVQSLGQVFHTPGALKAFKAKGINVTGAGGKIRNLNDIIVESLQKTQHEDRAASNADLNKLFMGQRSGRAIAGYEGLFRSTYASASGTKEERLAEATAAVRKEMERLTRAAMDQREVDESFNRAMKTGQSQAELWNNATQKAAKELQTALLPAFVALTPKVVSLASGFSDLIDFMMGKKKTPDGSALATDMDAIHKALKAPGGKVDQALVTKAIADSQKLGAQATDLENEARGLKSHRTGNVAYHAADAAGAKHSAYDITGLGTLYEFGKELLSGRAGKQADTEQAAAQRKADDASKQAMDAFNELRSATLKVHIVSSDVKSEGVGGAASPSTNTLSPNPSGS